MNFLRIRKIISLISLSVMLLLTIIIFGGCGGDLKTIPKRDLKKYYGSEMLTALLDEYKDIINIKYISNDSYFEDSNSYSCRIRIVDELSSEEIVEKASELSKFIENYINIHPNNDVNFNKKVEFTFYSTNKDSKIIFANIPMFAKDYNIENVKGGRFNCAYTSNLCEKFSDIKPLVDIEYLFFANDIYNVNELKCLEGNKTLKHLIILSVPDKKTFEKEIAEICPNCQLIILREN